MRSHWLILAILGSMAAATAAHAATACEALTGVSLPHAQVTAATTAPAGSLTACKIEVTSRPTSDSEIRIEVWIPVGAAWNGRYVQLGNGGLAGSISTPFLQGFAAQGYAAAMTDDGHQAQGTDGRWAMGHPEKVVDFGWRALKETTDAAKALIRAYGTGGPKFAYFFGCSDGGREALMEAQRFPNDFNGIVAGAPAYNFTGLLRLAVFNRQTLAAPGAFLPADKLGTLEAGAQQACGGGFFIADPAGCQFDPTKIVCKAEDRPDCVSAAQAAAARAIYKGLGGDVPGFTPGEEGEAGAWLSWITGPSPETSGQALSAMFARSFWGDFVFGDADYDTLKLDLAGAPKASADLAKTLNSTDPDLKAFRAHGGKLIQYHGWNDPAIPARASVVYYEDVSRTMGETGDFYRLYMIPGMLHCGGGPGPSNVNWMTALRAWVEQGQAPAAMIATGASATGPREQAICPYPDLGALEEHTGQASTARCLARKRAG
ncbi:MAG: tannase/feruloyl esterase family alpha/beta hydrolase [Caulobacterales bacterium]